jgi:hypothetical protein
MQLLEIRRYSCVITGSALRHRGLAGKCAYVAVHRPLPGQAIGSYSHAVVGTLHTVARLTNSRLTTLMQLTVLPFS